MPHLSALMLAGVMFACRSQSAALAETNATQLSRCIHMQVSLRY
jgi:hypothetical protein